MHCTRKITQDLYWVGASDRRLALFENVYPIPRGVSYNAYVLLDEKTVLFDTADASVSRRFMQNVDAALAGRSLDYLVINHMEPDHCACVEEVVRRYPGVRIVCNAKTVAMLQQFFDFDVTGCTDVIKEGDTLSTGRHTLTFVMAPMVHWPEAMVTYDTTDKILFSADAFGTFGAIDGNLFADEVNIERDYIDEFRRYYTNIVGKYGPQVQALLKKAAGLKISMICPLHGFVWRDNLGYILDKYQHWSTYTPEEKGVLIAFGSIYGNTEEAAEILAHKLSERGVKNIAMYDVSSTHSSVIVSEAFRLSHWVLASATYNGGIYTPMEFALTELKLHNLQNRTVAVLENGSWAPMAGKHISAVLDTMKNITRVEPTVTVKSAVKDAQVEALDTLADALAASVLA